MGSHEPCGMLGTEFWSSACTVRLSLELALLSILLPYTPWVVLFLVCLFLSFVFVSLCISGFLELALQPGLPQTKRIVCFCFPECWD